MRRLVQHGFTLLELLIVVGIIVVLAGIMIPAIVTITKNNAQKHAVNIITAYLTAARTRAIAEGRQVGVVFFEDSGDANRTAMQICVEANDPATGQLLTRTSGTGVQYTAFQNLDDCVEYLPNGISVATLSASAALFADIAENNFAGNTTRVILFDAQGQLSLRNGICAKNWDSTTTYHYRDIVSNGSETSPGNYISLKPANLNHKLTDTQWWGAAKWNFLSIMIANDGAATNKTQNNGSSAPGIFVFNRTEFLAATRDATIAQRSSWIKEHADILAINAHTGAVIR